MEQVVLLLHVFSTIYMCGLIWFVQIVHYPMFSSVGKSDFQSYEHRHQLLTTWVVALPMLLELSTGILLLRYLPPPSVVLNWIGLAALGLVWLTTATLSVPAHKKLEAGFCAQAHRKLVVTNWIRTVGWTFRSGLVLAMVWYELAEAVKS